MRSEYAEMLTDCKRNADCNVTADAFYNDFKTMCVSCTDAVAAGEEVGEDDCDDITADPLVTDDYSICSNKCTCRDGVESAFDLDTQLGLCGARDWECKRTAVYALADAMDSQCALGDDDLPEDDPLQSDDEY